MDTFTLTADIVNVPVGIQKDPIKTTDANLPEAKDNNFY